MELPKLSIRQDGSSGLAIQAIPTEAFNCAEFTLRGDVAQDVLIAPWIQFPPKSMNEWRLAVATEIVRRAMLHDGMLQKITSMEGQAQSWMDGFDRIQHRNEQIACMLRELIEQRDGKQYVKLDKGTDVTELLLYTGKAK